MFGGLLRIVVRLALTGLILYLAQAALRRWVDGSDPLPGDSRWGPTPGRDPAGDGWIPPAADGSAPASHPVKVKLASGIYHLPGGANYGRTRPDRCYATPEAAEAGGFTKAKR